MKYIGWLAKEIEDMYIKKQKDLSFCFLHRYDAAMGESLSYIAFFVFFAEFGSVRKT